MTQNQALEILKTGVNVFLTGEPGSGKTYLINQYIAYLRSHRIQPAITASTGIAATHIGGMTIHSWSGIGIHEYLDKYNLDRIASTERIVRRLENTSVLIIDEISMLSGSTLDMVEAICREVKRSDLPFGGLQIIFVGDFFQLPPVQKNSSASLKQFAYHSPAWSLSKPVICYLTDQYRQDDANFLGVLSAIRSDSFNEDHAQHIENRKTAPSAVLDSVPRLFTHNAEVDRVNDQMLARIAAPAKTFDMTGTGSRKLIETLAKGCLSPEKLVLKEGANVMFTKNHMSGGFVNGTLGVIEKFDTDSGLPIVKIRNGRSITVSPVEWTLEENGRVRARITQLPLRLAWAITIHKSQGMSMDAAAMDLSDVFEFGQGYVALSRVRRLAGLHIYGWNAQAFQVHPEILAQDQIMRTSSIATEAAMDKLPNLELGKIQENFLLSSGGNLEKTEKEEEYLPRAKGDTYLATLSLWSEGKTLADIVTARKLKETTILGHIERLFNQGKIQQADLGRLVTGELQTAFDQIHEVFRELSPEKLSPVFEKFHGRYSYDQLRIARMLFDKPKA